MDIPKKTMLNFEKKKLLKRTSSFNLFYIFNFGKIVQKSLKSFNRYKNNNTG